VSQFVKDLKKTSVQIDMEDNSEIIADIYDGFEYRKLLTNNVISPSWHDITIVLNTDGVNLFNNAKSGKVWPIYGKINELSPHLRFVHSFHYIRYIVNPYFKYYRKFKLMTFWCSYLLYSDMVLIFQKL